MTADCAQQDGPEILGVTLFGKSKEDVVIYHKEHYVLNYEAPGAIIILTTLE